MLSYSVQFLWIQCSDTRWLHILWHRKFLTSVIFAILVSLFSLKSWIFRKFYQENYRKILQWTDSLMKSLILKIGAVFTTSFIFFYNMSSTLANDVVTVFVNRCSLSWVRTFPNTVEPRYNEPHGTHEKGSL